MTSLAKKKYFIPGSCYSVASNFLETFADLLIPIYLLFCVIFSQLQVTRPKTDTLRRFLGVLDKHLTY